MLPANKLLNALHDLEIRGAGEVLGDQQSGNISEIGFENTPYDVKAKDFFIARAKIGLPFNIYNKKSGK